MPPFEEHGRPGPWKATTGCRSKSRLVATLETRPMSRFYLAAVGRTLPTPVCTLQHGRGRLRRRQLKPNGNDSLPHLGACSCVCLGCSISGCILGALAFSRLLRVESWLGCLRGGPAGVGRTARTRRGSQSLCKWCQTRLSLC